MLERKPTLDTSKEFLPCIDFSRDSLPLTKLKPLTTKKTLNVCPFVKLFVCIYRKLFEMTKPKNFMIPSDTLSEISRKKTNIPLSKNFWTSGPNFFRENCHVQLSIDQEQKFSRYHPNIFRATRTTVFPACSISQGMRNLPIFNFNAQKNVLRVNNRYLKSLGKLKRCVFCVRKSVKLNLKHKTLTTLNFRNSRSDILSWTHMLWQWIACFLNMRLPTLAMFRNSLMTLVGTAQLSFSLKTLH